MVKAIIERMETNPDLNFIPAYISTILSSHYALAKHPEVWHLCFSLLSKIITKSVTVGIPNSDFHNINVRALHAWSDDLPNNLSIMANR